MNLGRQIIAQTGAAGHGCKYFPRAEPGYECYPERGTSPHPHFMRRFLHSWPSPSFILLIVCTVAPPARLAGVKEGLGEAKPLAEGSRLSPHHRL